MPGVFGDAVSVPALFLAGELKRKAPRVITEVIPGGTI